MMMARVVAIAIALITVACAAGAQTFPKYVLLSGAISSNHVNSAGWADSSFLSVTRSVMSNTKVTFGNSAYGAASRSSFSERWFAYETGVEYPTDSKSFGDNRHRVNQVMVLPGVFGNSSYGMAHWSFFGIRPKNLDGADAPYVLKHLSGDVRTWKMLRQDYRKWLKLQEQTKKQIEKRRESIKPSMGTRKSDRSSFYPTLPLRKQHRTNTMEIELYRKFMDSFVAVPVSNGLKLDTYTPRGCDCECDPCHWICYWLCGSGYHYHEMSYKRIPSKALIDLLRH